MVGQPQPPAARSTVGRRADELLEQFGLADAANRPLKTYSGGMRRRLDLAAALVARPTVLFLDEPTTGLDPQSRNDLWEVIEELVRRGTTVLLTTQYLEEADRLADRAGRDRPRPGHRRGHAGGAEGRPGRHRVSSRPGQPTSPPWRPPTSSRAHRTKAPTVDGDARRAHGRRRSEGGHGGAADARPARTSR